MSWTEASVLAAFLIAVVAVLYKAKAKGGSCCGEGMDDDAERAWLEKQK